jgi:hypothetical protein
VRGAGFHRLTVAQVLTGASKPSGHPVSAAVHGDAYVRRSQHWGVGDPAADLGSPQQTKLKKDIEVLILLQAN